MHRCSWLWTASQSMPRKWLPCCQEVAILAIHSCYIHLCLVHPCTYHSNAITALLVHSKLHVQKTQHIRTHQALLFLLQAFLPWACTCMALRPHLPVPQVSCARHWMAWWQPPTYMQKSCCSFHPKAGSSCASSVLLAHQALPAFQSVTSSWCQACLASA